MLKHLEIQICFCAINNDEFTDSARINMSLYNNGVQKRDTDNIKILCLGVVSQQVFKRH